MVDKVEDTLNGGYGGLYGEVVIEDTYRMKQLKFIPDVIYDIGANVGIYTRFVKELFPNALVIAMEPDPENMFHLQKFTPHDRIIFINEALGSGQVYKCLGAVNGAHETYITAGPGNPADEMDGDMRLERSEAPAAMLDRIIGKFPDMGAKTVLKIDCEGNETVIFNHRPSMDALKKIDYICGEFHTQALTAELMHSVVEVTEKAMEELRETHDVERNHIYFFATKKSNGN